MLKELHRLFMAHPEAVNETYLEHFGVASRYGRRFLFMSFCAFTHAFFPFLFEKTASNMVKAMYADMTRRGASTPVAQQNPQTPAAEWGWL